MEKISIMLWLEYPLELTDILYRQSLTISL
jgi:hypothetical protein